MFFIKYLITLINLIVLVNCLGKLNVLTNPPSTTFKGHDALKQSLLSDVYAAALGYSIEEDSNWQGMFISDPFHLANAIVTIAVDGISDIQYQKGQQYPLRTDQDESETFATILARIQERNPNSERNTMRIELNNALEDKENAEFLSGIKVNKAEKTSLNYLKVTIDEDRSFLDELAILEAITDKIEHSKYDNERTPSLIWFKFNSLHAVSDLHGENGTATKEAKQLLNAAVERLNNAYKKYFDGNVLVNMITSDKSHTRQRREVAATAGAVDTATKDDFDNLNLALTYNADYPVIFNIILWFGVVMFFSLLAISMFIGGMDPGRDSIIYRMTSTRMKKDN